MVRNVSMHQRTSQAEVGEPHTLISQDTTWYNMIHHDIPWYTHIPLNTMILIDIRWYICIIVKVKIVRHLISQVVPLRYQVHISCVSQDDIGVDMIRDMIVVSDVSSFYFLWYHDGIMFSKRRVISSYIMSCICIMNISIYHVSTRDMIYEIQDDDTHDTQWYNQEIWWYIMISCIENSLFLYWK
jgi:hypothetical protein